MKLKFCVMIWWLTLCSTLVFGMQKTPVQDFSQDKTPEEALESVALTRQELLYDMSGMKIQKPKDPRRGLYSLFSIGAVTTPSLGTSSMLGAEIGYDFIFGKIHSIRVFGFFDRVNYGGFGDLEFNANKPGKMQVYRAGLSAEYRIYMNAYVGFRVRLASLGAYSLSRTDRAASPKLSHDSKKWLYPTMAFGPIFTYGKTHELFIGYDLIDYEKERGMSVNYIKYSLRF